MDVKKLVPLGGREARLVHLQMDRGRPQRVRPLRLQGEVQENEGQSQQPQEEIEPVASQGDVVRRRRTLRKETASLNIKNVVTNVLFYVVFSKYR